MKNTITRLSAKYRYSLILLKQLVKTDFKLRYQNSTLGYMWALLRPLMLFSVLYVVFVLILKTGGDVPHFGVYLLLGIVLWNYFVEVTTGGVGSIVGKGDIMRKVNFPRYVIVLSGSFSALINLALNLVVVSLFMWVGKAEPNSAIAFFPLLIAELFLFALSVSFFLSALYVKYRDINFIWEVIIQIGFYATPILYAITLVSARSEFMARLMLLNPVAQIIQDARYGLVTDKTTTVSTIYETSYARLIPFGIVLLVTILAATYFRRQAPRFAENV